MLVLSWSGLIGAVLRGTVTLERVRGLDVIFCFSRPVGSILDVDIDEMIRVRGLGETDGAALRTAVEAVNTIIREADMFGFVHAPINPEDADWPRRVFLKEALGHLKLSSECLTGLGDEICPALEDVKAAINAAHPDLVVII